MTIAGSDPSGGAGLQADLKTFHQFGVYGMAVPTLITVQNTVSVDAVQPLAPDLIRRQLESIDRDIRPSAVKTGALGGADVVNVIAGWIQRTDVPVVVDPVMVATQGQRLVADDAIQPLLETLLPAAFLVTPNLQEAAALAGFDTCDLASMREAARSIADRGARNVLITGGHLQGAAIDILWSDGELHEYRSERIDSRNTHGTGCTLSAAVTALLARGSSLPSAVGIAKRFVTEAIRAAPGLGAGNGPLNHHAPTGLKE